MFTAIKGTYEGGKIIFLEEPPTQTKSEVIITFLTQDVEYIPIGRKLGGLEGKVTLPEDFNEPLEDLKDYM